MKKTQKFTQSTETKLEGREHKAKDEVFKVSIRTFASALIALSGLVIFTDKVFSFELTELYGFYDEQTFVWMLSITIAPMLFCLGAIFKPYKISFLVPVYVSAIQLFWIFNPHIQFDDTFLQSYAIGAVLIIALLASIIHSLFNRAYEKRNQRIAQQAMDLDLEPVVKILIQFIVKHTQRKYISMLPREDQKNYRKDWLDTLREIDERSI